MNSSDESSPDKWHWVETHWLKTELQDQPVKFRAFDKQGLPIEGEGKFDVIDRPGIDTRKRVEIVLTAFNGFSGTAARYFLPQAAVDRIRKNDDSTFSLFLW